MHGFRKVVDANGKTVWSRDGLFAKLERLDVNLYRATAGEGGDADLEVEGTHYETKDALESWMRRNGVLR
jgi:hypothetical protein